MEELLKKMAAQLDALDEASLTNLWTKYARIVDNFEPTQRWEEAVLILSFIQAKFNKNQLFNYHWSARTKLEGRKGEVRPVFSLNLPSKEKDSKPATQILFNPKNKPETITEEE